MNKSSCLATREHSCRASREAARRRDVHRAPGDGRLEPRRHRPHPVGRHRDGRLRQPRVQAGRGLCRRPQLSSRPSKRCSTGPLAASPAIADKTVDQPAQNYYACVRNAAGTGCLAAADPDPGDSGSADQQGGASQAAGLNSAEVDANKDAADNKAYYVIERMCANARGRRRQQLQSVRRGRWAPTPERSITRESFVRATRSIASRFASRALAIPWRTRRAILR